VNPSHQTNPDHRTRREPLLTVVIVNFNSWPDVSRLVSSLAGTPEVGAGVCEVVVVDNASEGPVPVEFTKARRGVRLVARPDNGGFSAGVNAGRRAARSPWLLVLNPDVVVPAGRLGQVVARVARYEQDRGGAPGVVGFALLNPDGTRQPSVGAFPNLSRALREPLIPRSRRKYQAGWRLRPGPVDWVTGACLLIDARMLDELGGMDEDFFLYHEEVALCRSARDQGWRVEYDPGVEVVHLHPLQNRAISPKMRVITRHSKLLYFRKYLPRWQFAGLCRVVAAEAAMRRAWSAVQGRDEERGAWRAIRELSRAFRAGNEPLGRDVLTLAEAATARGAATAADDRDGRGDRSGIGSAGKRRGEAGGPLLLPRKDGPACR
jgi:N-acetylglucosaminyl-diphospho-decaprenol L-rhamnosyltransferase